jgi:hypothetical protein
MNRWAAEGGDPFADATWDAAWAISTVSDTEWAAITDGLRAEARRWMDALKTPREVAAVEFTGLTASIAHVAYHLGAIRQIHKSVRGPRNGTFPVPAV